MGPLKKFFLSVKLFLDMETPRKAPTTPDGINHLGHLPESIIDDIIRRLPAWTWTDHDTWIYDRKRRDLYFRMEDITMPMADCQNLAKIETICKAGVLETLTIHRCHATPWADPLEDPIAPGTLGLALLTRLRKALDSTVTGYRCIIRFQFLNGTMGVLERTRTLQPRAKMIPVCTWNQTRIVDGWRVIVCDDGTICHCCSRKCEKLSLGCIVKAQPWH